MMSAERALGGTRVRIQITICVINTLQTHPHTRTTRSFHCVCVCVCASFGLETRIFFPESAFPWSGDLWLVRRDLRVNLLRLFVLEILVFLCGDAPLHIFLAINHGHDGDACVCVSVLCSALFKHPLIKGKGHTYTRLAVMFTMKQSVCIACGVSCIQSSETHAKTFVSTYL